jgi:maleate isomerase
MIGCIKPAMRPGSLEELIRMLPEGIGVIPLFLDVRRGTREELENAAKAYEPLIARLAEQKVDIVLPEGAPPFMLLGLEGEAELIAKWEATYGIQIFTSGTNHTRALKALGVKRFVGASYFGGEINDVFSRYFRDAGFDVLSMEGIDVDFDDVNKLSPENVYAHIKRIFLKHPGAEGIYLLGSGWRVLPMIDLLERDLGVPVVHPVTARCWEIQLRLNIRQPTPGYGRLLAEMLPG